MSPSYEQRRLLSVTEKKHTNAPTAGARSTIFPELCTVIEIVEAIKKGVLSFFNA